VVEVLGTEGGPTKHAVVGFAPERNGEQFVVPVSLLDGLGDIVVDRVTFGVLEVNNLLERYIFALADRLSAAVQKCDDVGVSLQTQVSDLALEGEHVLFKVRLVHNHVGLIFYLTVASVIKEEQESLVLLDCFHRFIVEVKKEVIHVFLRRVDFVNNLEVHLLKPCDHVLAFLHHFWHVRKALLAVFHKHFGVVRADDDHTI